MSSGGSRHRKTAKSSRIPPQAREYISEMAEDRELERFMAFSSTASSGGSGSLHTCAVRVSVTTAEPDAGSRRGSGHRVHRPRSREYQAAVAGAADGAAEEALLPMPASPTTDQQIAGPMKSQEHSPAAADSYRIIPIVMVGDQNKSRPAATTQTTSLSVEDLRTPTKQPSEMHTKKTQTPESALKSHKRLEWDPAADVGYYKRAVSTSNISTLERSVLEECGWRQPMQQQRSETDLDRLQRQDSREKAGTPMQEKTTVPLASSTMVSRPVASAGASGKADLYSSSRDEVSNGSSRGDPLNSSSKGEAPPRSHKREASVSSSKREPSSKSVTSHCSSKESFGPEDSYRSSRRETTSLSSSKKETPCSSSRTQELQNSSGIEALQAQISSRRESLISSRRESLASNPQAASRRSSRAEFHSQSSSRMGSEMSSRRESQGTSVYGSSAASSFDYHINLGEEQEWLKSLQEQQQEGEPRREQQRHKASDQRKEPSGTTDYSEKDQRQTEHRSKDLRKAELRRAEQREKELEQERQFTAAQFERILGSRRRENKENKQPESGSTSASSLPASATAAAAAAAGHKRDLDLGIDLLCSLVEARSLSQGQKKTLVRDIARRISCLDLGESSSTASSRREARARGQPVPCQRQDVATNTSVAGSQNSSAREQPSSVVTLPVPAPRKRNADGTASSPLPSSSISATISSTSASNEVITQKTNIPTRDGASTDVDVEAETDADADADAEPMSAIRDALTPMTQSEIEYEERMKAGMDPERRSQLNWIEAEIGRLQSLKVFLAEIEENMPSNAVPMAADEELMISSDEMLLVAPQETDRDEEEQQKESSAEEGSRAKKAARQLAKAVQTEEPEEDATPQPPVRVESVRVPPRTACELPPVPPPHRYSRTKLATPVLASHSSTSGCSESVSSFVRQRHRRFREHYQNQQQQQLLLQKQQQLQRLQQQHTQQQHQLYQHKHQPHSRMHVHEEKQHHHVCDSHRPQHKGRKGSQQREQREQQEQYTQMMQYDQPAASGSAYATPHSSASGCYSCADNERERAIYYRVVNSPGASASYVQAEPCAAAATATSTTPSGSSMMCPSSEMSIPMGRVNTGETTTTTTHQYDDVACQRRKRRVGGGGGEERMQRQNLQVRPNGIAYVIQFGPSGSGEVVPGTRSLQDQLQLARPEFCAKSKQRKAILNQMQMMRNLRRREMDELVAENSGSLETLDRRLRLQLPPPATSRLRIFTTKEMKAMTTKKCQRLPEVLDAVNREVEMRRRRTNRLMRDIFNKRMRNRVSNGQVSLNHSRTII